MGNKSSRSQPQQVDAVDANESDDYDDWDIVELSDDQTEEFKWDDVVMLLHLLINV